MSGPILRSALTLAKKELENAPEDKTVAVVAGVDQNGTVFAGTVIKLNDEWVFDAKVQKELKKKVTAEVRVTFSK